MAAIPLAVVAGISALFGSETSSSEVRYEMNEVEQQQLQKKLDEINTELSTIKDPKLASQAMGNAVRYVCDEIRKTPLPKQKEKSLVVIGPTSAGKSTLLNAMFGLDLLASARRCTKGVNKVTTVQGLEIYDVFGTNPKQLYVQWDAVKAIATKHIALVCFSDALDNAIDAIELAVAGGLTVFVVRTKIDAMLTGPGETQAGIFAAEEAQAKQLGARYYAAVSALSDPTSLIDLKMKILAVPAI
jgi:energy-coupling factor transporter ATP-binding protein EcfA2